MRRALLAACLASLAPAVAAAQPHTIVALSHSDYTAYGERAHGRRATRAASPKSLEGFPGEAGL